MISFYWVNKLLLLLLFNLVLIECQEPGGYLPLIKRIALVYVIIARTLGLDETI